MNANTREILRCLRGSMGHKGSHAWKSQDFRNEMRSHLDTLIQCHGHSEIDHVESVKHALQMWAVPVVDGTPLTLYRED